MSVAVVSPAPSAAAPRQARGTASSAAQAYAALQHDAAQPTGQALSSHRHHGGKAPASPSGNAPQASATRARTGSTLNILA